LAELSEVTRPKGYCVLHARRRLSALHVLLSGHWRSESVNEPMLSVYPVQTGVNMSHRRGSHASPVYCQNGPNALELELTLDIPDID
jgi:hypothetical protein